jgi:hypothetical protein
VESGKRNSRPKLAEALAACKKHRARFVIAKLDRLPRNMAFIATLIDGKVDFACCAFPTANRLTLHILAAVAEHEREMIAKRTKDGLAAQVVELAGWRNIQLLWKQRCHDLEIFVRPLPSDSRESISPVLGPVGIREFFAATAALPIVFQRVTIISRKPMASDPRRDKRSSHNEAPP